MAPILAEIPLAHPFIGNAVDRDRRGTYQGKNLSQWEQIKSLKHAWADNKHIVFPFVSDTLGSMSGESAATQCLFAWYRAGLEAEFFVEDWGDGAGIDNGYSALAEASKRAFRRCARLTLALWRATVARATAGPRRQKSVVSQERGFPFPGYRGFRVSAQRKRVV